MNHLEQNVSQLGLETVYDMICNVETSQSSNEFFKTYLMVFLQEVFKVLTDKLHTSCFTQQSQCLQKIFQVISSGSITVPLWKDTPGAQFNSNQQFLCQHVKVMLV